MVDFNVDKLLVCNETEKYWEELTTKIMKKTSFKHILEKVLKISEKINGRYWKNRTLPAYVFEGRIMDLADSFGIEPIGKKLRICPFHEDTNPSLSLSDEKGLFHCFGCGVSGGVVKFYAMLKEVKNGNNKGTIQSC